MKVKYSFAGSVQSLCQLAFLKPQSSGILCDLWVPHKKMTYLQICYINAHSTKLCKTSTWHPAMMLVDTHLCLDSYVNFGILCQPRLTIGLFYLTSTTIKHPLYFVHQFFYLHNKQTTFIPVYALPVSLLYRQMMFILWMTLSHVALVLSLMSSLILLEVYILDMALWLYQFIVELTHCMVSGLCTVTGICFIDRLYCSPIVMITCYHLQIIWVC